MTKCLHSTFVWFKKNFYMMVSKVRHFPPPPAPVTSHLLFHDVNIIVSEEARTGPAMTSRAGSTLPSLVCVCASLPPPPACILPQESCCWCCLYGCLGQDGVLCLPCCRSSVLSTSRSLLSPQLPKLSFITLVSSSKARR